jgi:hypothetical protein
MIDMGQFRLDAARNDLGWASLDSLDNSWPQLCISVFYPDFKIDQKLALFAVTLIQAVVRPAI